MYTKIVFAFRAFLMSLVVHAQTNDIDRLLREIEQNNKEIQAYTYLVENKQFELKAGNNLPDPQAKAYYLPFGNHITGDYSELEISQSFEFPTVYGIRNALIAKQQGQIELEYIAKRQTVLLTAKKSILELVFLNKRMAVEQTRVVQAKKVVDQVHELFEKEQVGVLDFNKAKIAWMQEQFKEAQIETDRQNILLLLQNLNGGIEIFFGQPDFGDKLILASMDSLWQHRLLADPTIKILKQQEEVALQQIKLSKNNLLPNLTAGFNTQGISGSSYSGVYGGLSFPMWSNKNKVKAAEARYRYQQSYSSAQFLYAHADFQKQYNEYQILLSKFQEYQSSLGGLNSEALLLNAYELGEISFMEYYLELQFYRKAFDSMLQMENQLNQLKAEILKHQL